ncbi:hypothetical protein J14TS2_25590 [Bacillus sp. J14TS2]|nr:hypothetical protein J14TS2_25590 [Bacillus sp. J14TS2]
MGIGWLIIKEYESLAKRGLAKKEIACPKSSRAVGISSQPLLYHKLLSTLKSYKVNVKNALNGYYIYMIEIPSKGIYTTTFALRKVTFPIAYFMRW